MALRTICEAAMELGEELTLTFIDYSASFDSVSHKFIDRALKEAGASNKVHTYIVIIKLMKWFGREFF